MKANYLGLPLLMVLFFLANIRTYGQGNEEGKTPANDMQEGMRYYVWVDSLELRDQPGTGGRVMAKLAEGEAVVFLKETSSVTTRRLLYCREFESVWIKIQKSDGTQGWAFGAAFQEQEPENIIWKVIIAFYPGKPDQVSEDWVWFTEDVKSAIRGTDITLYELYDRDDLCLSLGPAQSNPLGSVDVEAIISKHEITTASYILIMKGKAPQVIDHTFPDEIIENAADYFDRKLDF